MATRAGAVLTLPASLDTVAASRLRDALRTHLGSAGDVRLDGSAVVKLGQACLQVLLAARSSAIAAGKGFTVDKPSEALTAMLRMVGGELLLREIRAAQAP